MTTNEPTKPACVSQYLQRVQLLEYLGCGGKYYGVISMDMMKLVVRASLDHTDPSFSPGVFAAVVYGPDSSASGTHGGHQIAASQPTIQTNQSLIPTVLHHFAIVWRVHPYMAPESPTGPEIVD